jgi:ATP-dependent DNA helicase RecQ
MDDFLIDDVIDITLEQLGYSQLREGQIEPIKSLLKENNTFVVLPTGAGKSLIYAMVCRAAKWKTVVFSPLVALMQDQVQSMCRKGIKAAYLSSVNKIQHPIILQEWMRGELEMLYIAPERLDNPMLLNALEIQKPDFAVLDEAHCMSKWSSSFRPKYAKCGTMVDMFSPKAVVALTATATKEIIADVKRILHIPDAVLCKHFLPRTNLNLSSSSVSTDKELHSEILRLCRKVSGSVLVYCSTVKQVATIAHYLGSAGESVTVYHAQMESDDARTESMHSFMEGRSRICVATNAFGMGIDKADIECVIHAQCPSSVEAIAQETGRAARDGRQAICHMFDTKYGRDMQDWFFRMENPEPAILRRTFAFLKDRADSNNEVAITVADMVRVLGDVGVEGAINYMMSLGIIERYAPKDRIYEITLCYKEGDKSTSLRKEIMGVIQRSGVKVREVDMDMSDGSMRKGTTYQIDINTIAALIGKPVTSVSLQFNNMRKDGYLSLKAPYGGSITKILRELADDDIEAAKYRWRSELKKIHDVRNYMNTPDKDKHKFLQDYFDLD